MFSYSEQDIIHFYFHDDNNVENKLDDVHN